MIIQGYMFKENCYPIKIPDGIKCKDFSMLHQMMKEVPNLIGYLCILKEDDKE